MTSAFASWADFFAMGGYALYVWLSVAFTLGPLALLALDSWLQHRRLMRDIVREQRRDDHESAS